jgi:Hg(II)-responsive transcriptional regulator
MPSLRTGQLARLANVNVETLRFYEREGLPPGPPRRASGYREYPLEAVDLVLFVQRAKELGFALKEVKELLDLREVPRATCGDVVALAERKVADIDAKISDLRAMRAALTKLLKECPGTAPITQCPIIESLAGTGRAKKAPRRPAAVNEAEMNGRRAQRGRST